MAKYKITESEDSTLVVFVDDNGEIHTADQSNPQLETIVSRLRASDFDGLAELFSLEKAVALTFDNLTDRISVADGHVYFDGDVLPDVIERLIIRSLNDQTSDYLPVVNFVEKVYTNSDKHTRDNLFTWLLAEDFTITTLGDIVAYKGLRADFTSIHSGPATVDGKQVNGHVANNVGSVVEIARSTVVADPQIGCAYGLHAGTYAYASGFAQGALVEVHINPRDVVSVPTDCNAQKMRVARYRVSQQITAKHDDAIVSAYADDDFRECYDPEYCGEHGCDC